MTQERAGQEAHQGHQTDEDAVARAAAHIARGLYEMQTLADARNAPVRGEVARSSAVLEQLAARIETSLAADKEQRHVMAGQLSQLAGALDSLVNHLQSLSHLMGDILERLAEPMAPAEEAIAGAPSEPAFRPGGEGITLSIAGVPGFAELVEIQNGLRAMEQVSGASVERFQEGESRILVHLGQPIVASALADGLNRSTSHRFLVEEAEPQLLRLKLKIVPGA